MKISLGIYPNEAPADIIASAKLADAMGYWTLWVLDSHLLFHEAYTLLGALAVSMILAIPVAPKLAPRDVILCELGPMVASLGKSQVWTRAK